MKLLVGLGNPGNDYVKTRHNIGWMALDAVAEKCGATLFHPQRTFQSDIAEARIGSEKVFLVKPTTYMNRSGEAVASLMSYYHLTPQDLLILQDEMDYPVGKFAFAASGRAAGHNGVRSIQESLATTDLPRLRLGIGRPQPPRVAHDHVLEAFTTVERDLLAPVFPQVVHAVEDWIMYGLTRAMNSWNGVEHGVDQRTDRASRLSPKSEDRE